MDLKFVNQLDNNELSGLIIREGRELLQVINNFDERHVDPNSIIEPDEVIRAINSFDRNSVDSNGRKCIRIDCKKGEQRVFVYYTITDMTMTLHQGAIIFNSYDDNLQSYLAQRFGKEYEEFLTQQQVVGSEEVRHNK